MYSDTYSVGYNIQHMAIYEWISQNKDSFDIPDSRRLDQVGRRDEKAMHDRVCSLKTHVDSINHQRLYDILMIKLLIMM